MIREQLDTTLDALRQQRDEVRVQLYLLGMEMRDEWLEAEQSWDRVLAAAQKAREASGDQLDEMMASFRQLADELEAQYQRIKPMERLSEGLDELRKKRDELRVQAHLMSMEAREEWEEAEAAWERLSQRFVELSERSGQKLEDVAGEWRELLTDASARIQRLAERLKG
ncbi:MAG: hypothetical protein ACOZAQ_02645 [Pseudomonadota bacterium]